MDVDIHSEVNFCVHGSKSLYHIVGATIWATKAPLLCDSRSKLSSWLFDRCSSSIRVETDDLQLLLGFWPCLIHRDGQQSHVHLFPTVRWSWFSPCVHLVYPKQRGWLEVKICRDSYPLFPFFKLNAAFICLQPSILCFFNSYCRKRSSMEGFWKARIYLVIAENQRSWKSSCSRLLSQVVSNLGALYEQRQPWWHSMYFFLYVFFSSDLFEDRSIRI